MAHEGIKGTSVVKLEDITTLPYFVQRIAKTSEAVIAAAIIPSESEHASNFVQPLITSLYQVGLSANNIVIPAIFTADSQIEAKALISAHSKLWIKSIVSLLAARDSGVVVSEPIVDTEVRKTVIIPGVSVEVLIENLRESLRAHGASGIVGLGRKFRIIDDDKSGNLDLSEFSKAISEHAFLWSPSQIKSVFDFFDIDKSGNISYDEFLVAVRGDLTERRQQLVFSAFQVTILLACFYGVRSKN